MAENEYLYHTPTVYWRSAPVARIHGPEGEKFGRWVNDVQDEVSRLRDECGDCLTANRKYEIAKLRARVAELEENLSSLIRVADMMSDERMRKYRFDYDYSPEIETARAALEKPKEGEDGL